MARQRGGMSAEAMSKILQKEDGDLNDFYNYYLEKADHFREVKCEIESIPKGDNVTNSIMVIDMQNDFVNSDGAFSVTDGKNMVGELADWINKNASKCTKVIFTRDSHPNDHCSFFKHGDPKENVDIGGPFPPHCIINSSGADMHPSMDHFSKLKNAEVIFKGMTSNADSFGAFEYPNDEYSLSRQIGKNCCKTHESCSNATGGFYIKNLSTEKAFGKSPLPDDWKERTKKFEIKDLLSGNEKEHNVFIVGLAGDYCVRDTAINIAKKGNINGTKINVFVIEPLVRYAFLPVFVGLVVPEFRPMKEEDLKESGRKDLSKYAFTTTESKKHKFKILSAEEAKSVTQADIDNMSSGYFHFLTDPRHIVKNYKDSGVKLLMEMPGLHRNIKNSRPPWRGGSRRNKKQRSLISTRKH